MVGRPFLIILYLLNRRKTSLCWSNRRRNYDTFQKSLLVTISRKRKDSFDSDLQRLYDCKLRKRDTRHFSSPRIIVDRGFLTHVSPSERVHVTDDLVSHSFVLYCVDPTSSWRSVKSPKFFLLWRLVFFL